MTEVSYLPPVAILILYFILHLVVGALLPYRAGQRPFFWQLMESAGKEMERRLNRVDRSASELFVRGIVVVILMAGFALLISMAVTRVEEYAFGWVIDLLLLASAISIMPTIKMVQKVLTYLNKQQIHAAAVIVQPFAPDDLGKADNHTVMRRALEIAAWRLNSYLIAPALFFLIFGARGLLLYVTLAALYAAFGTPTPRLLVFGSALRGIERVMNFIPACLTAFLVSTAAIFVSKSSPLRAFAVIAGFSTQDFCRNRGIVLGAFAGALGVTLAGPFRRGSDDVTIENGWIGAKGSSAQVSKTDLKRGSMIVFVVFILSIILLSAFYALEIFP